MVCGGAGAKCGLASAKDAIRSTSDTRNETLRPEGTRGERLLRHTYLKDFRLFLLLAAAVSSLWAGDPSARDLFKKGRKFEKAGNVAQAYVLYAQAAAADPARPEYWQRAQALRTKAATDANVMPVAALSAATPPPAATETLPSATRKEMEEARRPQPPVELAGTPGARDFDLRGDAKATWEQVAKAYGIDVVFDGDFQPGPPLRFRLEGADMREAFHSLMTATGAFLVPIGPKVAMVVKDTDAKRKEVENTIAVTVPIPEPLSLQEAQEMARSVQQLMEIQRFAIDSAQRVVLIRDRASKVVPAQALLRQMLQKRPEVMLEVEVIALPRTTSMRYGIGIPSAYPIVSLARTVALAGGTVAFGVGIAAVELLASWTKAVGTTLLKAELRSLDGTAASFHAGEKYPIVTMSYVGNVQPGDPGVYAPPPTFNFEDLGLGLKITPRVHDRHEVTLEIEAEYKLLGNATFNGNPVISSRKFANRARLRFDQAAMIAGLVSSASSLSRTGLAGVMSVPVLGPALSRTTRQSEDTETLLVIKPRLLGLPPAEVVTRPIYIGTESRMRSPL